MTDADLHATMKEARPLSPQSSASLVFKSRKLISLLDSRTMVVSKYMLVVTTFLLSLGFFWESLQDMSFRCNTEVKAVVASDAINAVADEHGHEDEPFPYPVNRTHFKIAFDTLPPPLQVMEEYMQWHSVEALRRDPNLQDRKLTIAFYQCPLQAGNRLHHFWNGVMWSVLTNRTVLWKYWSEDTCNKYGKEFNPLICKAANTAQDCGKVLTRAPWMASHDEWKDKLSLANEEPFVVPYHATMGRVWDDEKRFPLPPNYEDSYGVDLESKYPHKVLVFPYCHFKYWQLRDQQLQKSLLLTDGARERAKKLYSYGADFLFGMLHRYTFAFSSAILASIPVSAVHDNSQLFTIGLHSRHRYMGLDGCNIDRETACLDKILSGREDRNATVRVSIMSDRPCTVTRLSSWLQERNCSVLTAEHPEPSPDYIREHGPNAGIGFFQDLALVSNSRSAIVAMTRTSSDLLRELMVFQRMMEEWEMGDDPFGRPIDSCVLTREADPARMGES